MILVAEKPDDIESALEQETENSRTAREPQAWITKISQINFSPLDNLLANLSGKV